jgi:hypothetical protein
MGRWLAWRRRHGRGRAPLALWPGDGLESGTLAGGSVGAAVGRLKDAEDRLRDQIHASGPTQVQQRPERPESADDGERAALSVNVERGEQPGCQEPDDHADDDNSQEVVHQNRPQALAIQEPFNTTSTTRRPRRRSAVQSARARRAFAGCSLIRSQPPAAPGHLGQAELQRLSSSAVRAVDRLKRDQTAPGPSSA